MSRWKRMNLFAVILSGLASFGISSHAQTLGDAVDATQLVWTTGGNAIWLGQTNTTHDGVDAAQSGVINNSQFSTLDTVVTGAITLAFWWKVSSESGGDFLRFYVDGVQQSGIISGEVNWQQKTYSIASGVHTCRWSFTKDGSVSSGSDAGWLDQIEILPPGYAPEIALLGTNGALIALNDFTPSQTDGTIFATTLVSSGWVEQVFTITNSGLASLNISGVTTSGVPDFSVRSFPQIISGNAVSNLVVRFDPTAAGTRTTTLYIQNSDSDEGSYGFSIQGTGVAPEIAISGTNNALIAIGDLTPSPSDGTDFGVVTAGVATVDRTFFITNSGSVVLSLFGASISGTNAAGFSVLAVPSFVSPASQSNLVIRFSPAAVAPLLRFATVAVTNDDSDEGNYTFAIQALVVNTGVEISVVGTDGSVIVDGDATPSVSDGTDFGSSLVTSGFVDRTFFISNSGPATLLLAGVVKAGAAPGDFSILAAPSTVGAGAVSNLTVRFDPTTVGLRSATIVFTNNDPDELAFDFAVQGTGLAPEIVLLGTNGAVIVNNDFTPTQADGTVFGSILVSSGAIDRVFFITNSGAANLNISGVSMSGSAPGDFTSMAFPPIVNPGSLSNLVIRFDPTRTGTRTATVVIQNDDPDEAPSSFSVQGTGIGPEISVLGTNGMVLTNNSPASLTNGTDFGAATVGGSPVVRTFFITNAGPDLLIVETIFVGGTAPADFTVLSFPTNVQAGTISNLVVRFAPTSPFLRAATLQIFNNDEDEAYTQIPVQGTATGPEVAVLGTNLVVIPDGDSTLANGANFGTVLSSTGYVERTFFVTNSGSLDLIVSGVTTGGVASDFTVMSWPGTVSPGAVSNLVLRFDPSGGGTRLASISLQNNDLDETPYDFMVSGSGSAPEIEVRGINAAVVASSDTSPQTADGTDFGQADVGSAVDRYFTLANVGQDILVISNAGPVAGDF